MSDPSLALVILARDDAAGLRRAIGSTQAHVDELIIGVDERSDEETRVAAAELVGAFHAPSRAQTYVFGARDLDMSVEDWAADKIRFSAARNLANSKAVSDWILTLDTDEYIEAGGPLLRDLCKGAVDAYRFTFASGGRAQLTARLVRRSHAEWRGDTHNRLSLTSEHLADESTVKIVHDTSLRSPAHRMRREFQREQAVLALRIEAEKGDMSALFHLAKHFFTSEPERFAEGCRLAEDFRLRAVPHGGYRDERYWLALGIAINYFCRDDYANAEMWALRALFDGPRIEPLCLLGDLAEEQRRTSEAVSWYTMACALPDAGGTYGLPELVRSRHARLDALSRLLGQARTR